MTVKCTTLLLLLKEYTVRHKSSRSCGILCSSSSSSLFLMRSLVLLSSLIKSTSTHTEREEISEVEVFSLTVFRIKSAPFPSKRGVRSKHSRVRTKH